MAHNNIVYDRAAVLEWVAINSPRARQCGFSLEAHEVDESDPDVPIYIDAGSDRIVSRIYIYNTGLVDLDAHTRDKDLDVRSSYSDESSTVENLDSILIYLFDQHSRTPFTPSP